MTDQSSELFPAELRQITHLIYGFMTSQAIAVAAKLGIADLLKEEPKSAQELANATKAHAPSLNRLLRMLTSVGIFVEDANGRFQQTPLSELLRGDHPRSARRLAMMLGSEFAWRPWGDLYETVMTGQPAFDRVFGSPGFDYAAEHPDAAEIFIAGMTSGSAIEVPAVVAAYDFSHFERIVDVGGGQGALLHAILSATPGLHGVLADQPYVVASAASLQTGPIAERCEVATVDFFQAVPGGADAYIMKWIIHDWNDEDCLKILRNCRRVIRRDGTLLIVDAVLKPPNEPDPGKLMDLNMLVLLSGGRERTEAEFAALLRRADFSLTRVIPTVGTLSIIESQPT